MSRRDSAHLCFSPSLVVTRKCHPQAKLLILSSLDESTHLGVMLEDSGRGLWSLTGDLDASQGNWTAFVVGPALHYEVGWRRHRCLEKRFTAKQAHGGITTHGGDDADQCPRVL